MLKKKLKRSRNKKIYSKNQKKIMKMLKMLIKRRLSKNKSKRQLSMICLMI